MKTIFKRVYRIDEENDSFPTLIQAETLAAALIRYECITGRSTRVSSASFAGLLATQEEEQPSTSVFPGRFRITKEVAQ